MRSLISAGNAWQDLGACFENSTQAYMQVNSGFLKSGYIRKTAELAQRITLVKLDIGCFEVKITKRSSRKLQLRDTESDEILFQKVRCSSTIKTIASTAGSGEQGVVYFNKFCFELE